MSDQDDMSAWGDALAEQADAEGSSTAADDDPWGSALAEQAEADATSQGDIDAASFDALEKGRGEGGEKVDLDVLLDIPVTL